MVFDNSGEGDEWLLYEEAAAPEKVRLDDEAESMRGPIRVGIHMEDLLAGERMRRWALLCVPQ
jgi:hypothetical protein